MEIGNYSTLYNELLQGDFHDWAKMLMEQVPPKFDPACDGNLHRWISAMDELPEMQELSFQIDEGHAAFGNGESFPFSEEELTESLKKFIPWRKGPWELGGVRINTEWHSDWKWERLAEHISSPEGRTILDVGSGNGYYCYRMAEMGAKMAIGIDPGMLAVCQFTLMKRYSPNIPVWVLPLGVEEMPAKLPFDTVFSMGVLYHRRSPIDHILQLKGLLRSGGELVLETIVIDESEGDLLVPEGRYQQMRNVWFLPSVSQLERWLVRCGFENVRTVSVEATTVDEQRSTEWMPYDSLEKFLDPEDHSKTIEGYPAPKRAVVIANAP